MKYNVVTGWRRGGTSALMVSLKQAGFPILGFKYPVYFSHPKINEKYDGGILEARVYERNLNPTGFWELASIVQGKGLQKKHYDLGFDNDIVKVPFGVLPLSNPDLINKVIIILREPAKVIASQYKTIPPKKREKWLKTASQDLLLKAETSLAWLIKYRKDFVILHYKDLLEKEETVLSDIEMFFTKSKSAIKTELDRVKPMELKGKNYKRLIEFYKNNI